MRSTVGALAYPPIMVAEQTRAAEMLGVGDGVREVWGCRVGEMAAEGTPRA